MKTPRRQVTVLGSYDTYRQHAIEKGANYFETPLELWNKMKEKDRLDMNFKFIQRAVDRGDDIELSIPFNKSKNYPIFTEELNYLKKKGYHPSDDNMSMILTK